MARPLNRVDPQLPAHSMKTYEVSRPLSTHWRIGTCEEAGCLARHKGWKTTADESTDLGARQAAYIRQRSGRRFSEAREGELTVFDFPPGQDCFKTHQVPLAREPLFVVREGDWRGNPRRTRPQILRPDQWVDDFRTHQDNLARKV